LFSSCNMKIIIFHLWLLPLAKYWFSNQLMKINPVFKEKTLIFCLLYTWNLNILYAFTFFFHNSKQIGEKKWLFIQFISTIDKKKKKNNKKTKKKPHVFIAQNKDKRRNYKAFKVYNIQTISFNFIENYYDLPLFMKKNKQHNTFTQTIPSRPRILYTIHIISWSEYIYK
jgi:hypothetical protein